MEDSSGTNSTETETPTAERSDDATSKETVKDLDEATTEVPSEDSEPSPAPSPDGSLRGGDENKDAGPM